MNPQEIEFFDSNDILFQHIIAQGGSGTVFYVHSIQYNANFALKKIPEEIFQESEVECLKEIDDPRIVSLYKIYKFENYVYLLFEYCPTDLEKTLRQNKNTTHEEVKRYCRNVICCVKSCHDRKVAHSDIKPSNFLIDKYDRIKIGDFGLSQIYDDNPSSTAFKGTLYFMSPEIFMKQKFNPMAADIWALGVTLYYIAVRKYPFKSKKTAKILTKIQTASYKKELVTDPDLLDIIERCLKIDPKERATCDELLAMPYFKNEPKQEVAERIPLNRKDSLMKSHNLIVRPQISKGMISLSMSRSSNHSRIQLLGSQSKSSQRFNL